MRWSVARLAAIRRLSVRVLIDHLPDKPKYPAYNIAHNHFAWLC
jgi:hypothetical protein